MDQTSFWHPADSVGLMAASLIVIVCFALIAAFMILALVESYVVISAGVLFMGFGGSRWTKDYAVNTMPTPSASGPSCSSSSCWSCSSQQLFQEWSRNFGNTNSDIFVVVGSAIVMLALVKVIPDMMQGLINGALRRARAAPSSPRPPAPGRALGRRRDHDGRGHGGRRRRTPRQPPAEDPKLNTGKFGDGWLGRTARNLAGAAVRNVGATDRRTAPHGTRFGQMADDMNERSGGDALDRMRGRSRARATAQLSAATARARKRQAETA